MGAFIEFRGVRKAFGTKRVYDRLDLDIKKIGKALTPLNGIEDLNQFLLLLDRQHHVGTNGVGQASDIVDFDRGQHLICVQILA